MNDSLEEHQDHKKDIITTTITSIPKQPIHTFPIPQQYLQYEQMLRAGVEVTKVPRQVSNVML